MVNLIVITGRMVADPELRYTPKGTAVAGFRIAVDRSFVPANGNREADFFSVVAWGKLGETVANNLKKGRLCGVEGRMQMRSYEAQDGTKRTVWELIAQNIHFLDSKKDGAAGSPAASTPESGEDVVLPDDLPF